MKKAVVIGGTGQIGEYLVPMLVMDGYSVSIISRGQTKPAIKRGEWKEVAMISLRRGAPDFEKQIASLNPDIVIDIVCYENDDMMRLVNALRGVVSHYLAIGSGWIHGRSGCVPVLEEECRNPLCEYGIQKDLMDKTLTNEYKENGFPGSCVHPGHIICPGRPPVNPQGHDNLEVFETLRQGRPLYLPNFGMETLHHVHADDVAGVLMAAIRVGKPSFGEGFHAVSPRAVTLCGYAEEVSSWFGKEADLHFEPFEQWRKRVAASEGLETLDHITHSPCYSMEKAARILHFTPAHTTFESIRECLTSFKQFRDL